MASPEHTMKKWSEYFDAYDTDPIQTIPRPHPTPAPAPAPKRQKRKSTKSSSRSSYASIDDADFQQTVLIPRGVEVLRFPVTTAYEFSSTRFGTKDIPKSKKKAFYKKKHEERMKIFINGGSRFVKDVVKEYRTFDSWRLIERRWSNLALKYFLKEELMGMDHEKTNQFMAEGRDEESIQPDTSTKSSRCVTRQDGGP